MKSILIGIPTVRYHQGFWNSMASFLPAMSQNYRTETVLVRNKPIDEARTEIVKTFMAKDYNYLLFLDDDHTDHTISMVEALLEPNDFVCAIKCYSRFFPYTPCLMDYSGFDDPSMKYEFKKNEKGYDFCNLVGFGMTLIRRELFGIIPEPWFVSENNQREDNFFCDKMQFYNIKPMGCFDYVLPHDGIDEAMAKKLQNIEINRLMEEIKVKYPEHIGKQLIIAA